MRTKTAVLALLEGAYQLVVRVGVICVVGTKFRFCKYELEAGDDQLTAGERAGAHGLGLGVLLEVIE